MINKNYKPKEREVEHWIFVNFQKSWQPPRKTCLLRKEKPSRECSKA